jgi:hypothetical protein
MDPSESRQEKLERLRLQREAERKKKENNLESILNSLDQLDQYLDKELKDDEVYGFSVVKEEVKENIVKVSHKINKISDLIDKFNKI